MLQSAECIGFNHIHFAETSGTCLIGQEHTPTHKHQQSIVKMRASGTSGSSPEVIRTTRVLPGLGEQSRPKHDVTEGIMTLAEDKRPEATLLIGLSYYALQRQSHIVYELTRQVL